MKSEDIEACAGRINALANSDRLRLLDALLQAPATVTQLCQLLSIPMVKASHHLLRLTKVGIVKRHREGRNIVYSPADGLSEPKSNIINLGCCRLDLGKKQAATRLDARRKEGRSR